METVSWQSMTPQPLETTEVTVKKAMSGFDLRVMA